MSFLDFFRRAEDRVAGEGRRKSSDAEECKTGATKVIRETIEAIVIALILAVIIRTFVLQAFKIPSSSMEDTLLIGDHILVSKFAYGLQVPRPAMVKMFGITVPFFDTDLKPIWGKVERGDVVVFRFPGDKDKDFIKRAIGLPGDRIEVRNKVVYVNGKQIPDTHAVFKGSYGFSSNSGSNFASYLVPEGHIFAMGDNRDNSHDSRFWGPVPVENLRGRAFAIYFSWDAEEKGVRFGRIGSSID
jgi:signal peptidase I